MELHLILEFFGTLACLIVSWVGDIEFLLLATLGLPDQLKFLFVCLFLRFYLLKKNFIYLERESARTSGGESERRRDSPK